MLKQWFMNNFWLFFGISVGIFFSSIFSEYNCIYEAEENTNLDSIFKSVESDGVLSKVVPRLQNATRKPKQEKEVKKLVRPRYYSTELGMRDKLFVGVLSSEEKINSQAIHVNKTIAHLVDKVKFFITAQQNLKNKFNLSIVGFTDTRHVYRPFQVVKYIGDPFIDEYDYYFLMYDFTYLNARKLKAVVDKISVSLNVYMGTMVRDTSYCDLDAGILLSNSVIKAMKENLDWCVRNAVSEDDSENLGRCIYHSTKLTCQEVVQRQRILGFKLKTFDLENDLEKLIQNLDFQKAVTIYSVLQKNDFYLLHTYFSKQNLKEIKARIDEISEDLTDMWPPGRKNNGKPVTRFDIPQTLYFNMSHMFFPDDFVNIRKHTSAEGKDINYVVDSIVAKVLHEKPDDFHFTRLINGYRTFHLSRGLDYQLDLGFRDLHTGKEVIKRFEVCKQLGDIEFLAKPYTTENIKVTILLPIQEHERDEAMYFLNDFIPNVMEAHEKVVLMLVFLYQYNTVSKGNDDYFKNLKDLATQTTNKYHSEDTKIAWVSIRLPLNNDINIKMEDYPVLNFAVIDLALKKIGLDSLVLVLDVYCEAGVEFLNRVKMNTISEFQIFNPIPFRQYNPEISGVETFEVHKDCGHFDREEYKYLSFYGRDYVKARKDFSSTLPIVKLDSDISTVLQDEYCQISNVFEMFVMFLPDVHGMRATEAALKVRYHDVTYNKNRENLFLGTKSQLAKIILEQESSLLA
ncbi:hypothetical protein Trydic_g20404 [Trypoxylus dichotomus]